MISRTIGRLLIELFYLVALSASGSVSAAASYRWQVLVSATRVPQLPVDSEVKLSHPQGLAIDRRGRSASKWMYLADTNNSRIIKLGTGGRYLGTWGRQGTDPGQYDHPAGVAVDSHGNVFVADTGNDRIEKIAPNGKFLMQWGTKGPAPGQFDQPVAIAVGGSDNVFVADQKNNRIEKFTSAGRLRSVFPVKLPPAINLSSGDPSGPIALIVDATGHIYVAADTGQCGGSHCVMDYIVLESLAPSGTVTRIVVGGNPYGGFYPSGKVAGPWWQIGALATDRQNHLFVSEWSPQVGATVTELSPSYQRIAEWKLPAPSGDRGWPGQGIAVDPSGNVYVGDTLADRVLKLIRHP